MRECVTSQHANRECIWAKGGGEGGRKTTETQASGDMSQRERGGERGKDVSSVVNKTVDNSTAIPLSSPTLPLPLSPEFLEGEMKGKKRKGGGEGINGGVVLDLAHDSERLLIKHLITQPPPINESKKEKTTPVNPIINYSKKDNITPVDPIKH